MMGFAITTHTTLLILRSGSEGPLEIRLEGSEPGCVAVDPADIRRMYIGTLTDGLRRREDVDRG